MIALQPPLTASGRREAGVFTDFVHQSEWSRTPMHVERHQPVRREAPLSSTKRRHHHQGKGVLSMTPVELSIEFPAHPDLEREPSLPGP